MSINKGTLESFLKVANFKEAVCEWSHTGLLEGLSDKDSQDMSILLEFMSVALMECLKVGPEEDVMTAAGLLYPCVRYMYDHMLKYGVSLNVDNHDDGLHSLFSKLDEDKLESYEKIFEEIKRGVK